MRRDDSAHPDLLAQRILHRFWERPPGLRESAQCTSEDAVELEHRTLVIDHRVKRLRLEAGMIEAPCDRRQGERCVALAPRQTLLLHRADRYAVNHKRRRRIVIMRRNPENLHVNTRTQYWRCRGRLRCGETGVQPGNSRRSARLASQANGGRTTKY